MNPTKNEEGVFSSEKIVGDSDRLSPPVQMCVKKFSSMSLSNGSEKYDFNEESLHKEYVCNNTYMLYVHCNVIVEIPRMRCDEKSVATNRYILLDLVLFVVYIVLLLPKLVNKFYQIGLLPYLRISIITVDIHLQSYVHDSITITI